MAIVRAVYEGCFKCFRFTWHIILREETLNLKCTKCSFARKAKGLEIKRIAKNIRVFNFDTDRDEPILPPD